MTKRLLWSPEAENDLLEIWAYLADQASPSTADEYLRAIDAACHMIGEWPLSGRPRQELHPDIRSVPVKSHIVFYAATARGPEIVRVLHAHRDIGAVFAHGSIR